MRLLLTSFQISLFRLYTIFIKAEIKFILGELMHAMMKPEDAQEILVGAEGKLKQAVIEGLRSATELEMAGYRNEAQKLREMLFPNVPENAKHFKACFRHR